MQTRSDGSVVVLGGGRGLASVLRALRDEAWPITAIVGITHRGALGGDAEHQATSAPVEDLRNSLEALTRGEGALLRAIRRPLTIERLGRHPLGNLVIASVAAAFGDYGRASTWLGGQLGVEGRVLPATVAPVQMEVQQAEGPQRGEPLGSSKDQSLRVRYVGERPVSPDAAVAAIRKAQWVVLAPGSLYRCVLATVAVPDLLTALSDTPAGVLWIANLGVGAGEAAGLSAIGHVLSLRYHGIPVDAVMHDPSAALRFGPGELARYRLQPISRELRSAANPALHDPERLRSALRALIGTVPASKVG
jgi:uncharacterized cofD-like protein